MALNQNHICEELEGVKCSVIEKNCSTERVSFLKEILEHNGFTVVVTKSASPKAVPKPTTEGETASLPEPSPELFTIGVTDLSFNTINALFNRELKTKEGLTVTPKYWKQKESISKEASWYWKK